MLAGRLLGERYKIEKKIGGGGMANVYLANDTILKRDVAIKVLRLEYANDQEFITRFDREAQAATSLSHPNVVNIYDVGEEDNILYMVMEYVEGLTLKEYIQQGPVEVEEALNIMKQITAAIAHAHANDLVHRDIKPQNILLDPNGQVKVTDFGIAIALSATALTQTNSILGSVHYLSPEQARGGLATKISDIYSLGIVFFELLTGRLPFSGETPVSIALKHLQNDTPSVRQFNQSVPQSVENIVLKATDKDPFHRFQTVYEMDEALETALNPSKINEKRYETPVEAGEETKIIPIITDNQGIDFNEDTIVHSESNDTKVFPDNKDTIEPKSKKKRWKIWVLSLSAIFIISILLLFMLSSFFKLKDVPVPDLIDLEYEEALEELLKLNLEGELEEIPSEDVEEGLVVKTDPRAGRMVKEKSTIVVYVSEGKEKVVFGDYVGDDYNQVKRLLEGDYKDVISYEQHSDKPAGEIISQVQPDVGSEVIPSDTQVIFEVSIGPELISLNNLKGMSEKEVQDYLDTKGLLMNRMEETSGNVPVGQVIRQNPAANTGLEEGDSVDVYLSIGPEKKPPVQHPVTFSVQYTGMTEDEDEDDDEEPIPVKQKVMIYIEDMNNNITEVFLEDEITSNKEYTITLVIEENKTAEYKVMREDELLINKTIPYKEGG